jgi:hypothetical protein
LKPSEGGEKISPRDIRSKMGSTWAKISHNCTKQQKLMQGDSMNVEYHTPHTSGMTFGPPLLNGWPQI